MDGPSSASPAPSDAGRDPRPRHHASGRAGRNLPVAVGVGVVLGAVVLASLFVYPLAFPFLAAAAASVGLWELCSALRSAGLKVPTVALIGCGWGMLAMAWFGGASMLAVGLGVTVAVLVAWRLAEGATGYHVDLPAAVLAAVYVPFLAGFAILLTNQEDGAFRVLVTLAVAVLSDTGGYIAGVIFGKHPMAPKVSPKKSWEGLAGSLLASGAGGAVMLHFIFDVAWHWGALFGLALAVAAVLGDLAESMIKRDLGVKDMSRIVPGHGGLMDRLDSILAVLPVSYALLYVLAP